MRSNQVVAFINSLFKELMFKLPEDNGHVLGKPREDITQQPLRFAIHPGKDRPMIAMATANYEDLKIMVCVNNFLVIFFGKDVCLFALYIWDIFIEVLHPDGVKI